jgi:hypothetical protein
MNVKRYFPASGNSKDIRIQSIQQGSNVPIALFHSQTVDCTISISSNMLKDINIQDTGAMNVKRCFPASRNSKDIRIQSIQQGSNAPFARYHLQTVNCTISISGNTSKDINVISVTNLSCSANSISSTWQRLTVVKHHH